MGYITIPVTHAQLQALHIMADSEMRHFVHNALRENEQFEQDEVLNYGLTPKGQTSRKIVSGVRKFLTLFMAINNATAMLMVPNPEATALLPLTEEEVELLKSTARRLISNKENVDSPHVRKTVEQESPEELVGVSIDVLVKNYSILATEILSVFKQGVYGNTMFESYRNAKENRQPALVN